MNIVLADVKSIQPGQVDVASEKAASDDKFSRFFNRQLNQEEALSEQVKNPQVIETKGVMTDFIEPVSSLDQPREWIDGLNLEILANPSEAESPQLEQIIDYRVNPDSAGTLEQEAGEALPSDGHPLPPAASQVSLQPVEEQSIPVQQQPIPIGQQSILMQQPMAQIPPVTNNPVKPVNLKTDAFTPVPHSGDSVLMVKDSVSAAPESAVVNKSEAFTDKLNFGKSADFQLTNSALNSESDINNNLFRLHSPTGLTSLNHSPQSLPPHLESLPLPNPRDQVALSGGLGDRIQWMVNQKLNTATIRMDPPMLGRLEVHIQVADDITNVTINTQHAQTRDLIENASMRLREYLQENGYENVNVDVSHQQQQQASDQGGVSDDFLTDEKSAGSEADIKHEADGSQYFSSDSVVDYFA